MSFKHLTLPLAATATVVMLLSGCVVAPAGRPVYAPQPQVVYPQQQPQPQVVYPQQGVPQPVTTVYVDPPPPQVEMVGVAPAPGYFWIGGVWLWQGNRHVWHPGHWEPQRAGHVYVPHRWERAGQGWQLRGGHWNR